MNIVYVSREYGPITGGGIGTYVTNACRAMLQRGHQVYLLTDCVDDSNRLSLPEGLQVVPTVSMPVSEQGGCFSYNHEYSHRVYKTLVALCEQTAIDVVEFAEYCGEGFIAIRAKRLLNEFSKQTLIVKCHTPLSLLEKINEDRDFHFSIVCDMEMEDYCIRHADRVTSPSQSLADYFQDRVGRSDIKICPYPLYLDFADHPIPILERDLKVIRFFGSVQVRKGVDVFIQAAVKVLASNPDFRFEIVGQERNACFFNHTYTEVLQQLIPPGLEDKIVFTGGVPYHQVASLLDQSGIIILPSRWENWANACLESMSKGCLVMASSSGGMAEMIEDGVNGFVIDPLDPEALAQRVLAVVEKGAQLQGISSAAIDRAHELTEPESTARRMEANYQPVLRELPFTRDREPLVSVIIPYYNQAATIEETIQSVRQSDYRNLEIVVVNDGSTSPGAIQRFESLQGVVQVNKVNGGLSSARNAGIRASKGEYFLPLDSDDCIDSSYIRNAVHALENCPELGYVTCYTRNFGAIDTPYYPVGYVPMLMPIMNTSGKCSNLYRRSSFNRIGGYDEDMNSYEDWDLLLSLHDKKVFGDVIPREFLFYRRGYASMVYSVADPIRANLIQYMMSKHRSAWKHDSEMMAMLLLRLWKDAEIRDECHGNELFSFYWGNHGALSEDRTRVMNYRRQGNVVIEYTIPYDPTINTVRLDFATSEMTIAIQEVRITDLLSGDLIVESHSKSQWEQLQVAGTAEIVGSEQLQLGDHRLWVRSTGEDPQLLLQSSAFEGKELHVMMRFEIVSQA